MDTLELFGLIPAAALVLCGVMITWEGLHLRYQATKWFTWEDSVDRD